MTDLLTSEVRSSGHILQPRPLVLGQEILVVSKVAPSVDQPPWPRKLTWTDAIDDGSDDERVLISDLDEARPHRGHRSSDRPNSVTTRHGEGARMGRLVRQRSRMIPPSDLDQLRTRP